MADNRTSLLVDMQRRYETLKAEFSLLEPHYRDITRRLLPRNGRYQVTDRNKAAARRNDIIDNTGTRQHRVMKAGLMTGLSSPYRVWHQLQIAGDPDINKSHNVRAWLDDVENMQRSVWSGSNTYGVLEFLYGECGGYGTACATVMAHPERVIHLYPQTVGQYVLATNPEGEVNTLMRRYEMTVGQLVRQFGYASCSQAVQNDYDNKQFHNPRTVVHAIEPRMNRDASKLDNRNMPFRSVYWEEGEGREVEDVLRHSGFKRFPVLAPRWTTQPGDSYGSNCPGMEALGDLISLDADQFRKGQIIDYLTKPPTQGPPGTKTTIDKRPGAHNEVPQTGPGQAIQPLWQVGMDVNALLEDIRDIRLRITSSFFADLFLLLANNPKEMTKAEALLMNEERMLVLGPVVDRLTREMLAPLVEMTFDYLDEAGLLPPPPPEIEGMEISVEFVSALAQAQRMVQSQSVDRFVVGVAGMSQLKPEVLDRIDADEWAEEAADMYAVPPKLLVPREQAAELRQARAKAEAAQAMQQAQSIQAGTARDLALAAKEAPQPAGAL